MDAFASLLRSVADRHHVFTTADAEELGISRATLRRWVAAGRLDAGPGRGAYAIAGMPWTYERRVAAAIAAIGPPVHATGRSALYLRGVIRAEPDHIEVVIPESRRAPTLADARVRRSRTLLRMDTTSLDAIPIVRTERALADLAAGASVPELLPIVIDSIQRRETTAERLGARLRLRLHWPCRSRLLEVLARVAPHEADSVFEHIVRERLNEAGFTPAVGPVSLTLDGIAFQVDVAFVDHRIAIECDGLAYHRDREAMQRDHRKDAALAAAGWVVLRLDWDRLHRDWSTFLRQFTHIAATRGLRPAA